MIDELYNILERTFTLDKIKNDLLVYLEVEKQVIFEISIWSEHEITGIEKEFFFSSNDKIVIESISTNKKYLNQLYLPYQVNIIIGDFYENRGIAVYKKNRFEMFYDDDLNLTVVDIFHVLE